MRKIVAYGLFVKIYVKFNALSVKRLRFEDKEERFVMKYDKIRVHIRRLLVRYLSFLIKPASSSCTLHCRYCFYNDVSEHREFKTYGNMEEETFHALIDQACDIVDDAGDITFAFQGGEPTVVGITFFHAFCAYVDQRKKPNQKIHYAIQTNAYSIDEAWCELFSSHSFLVGVSLDGYKENHDYFRLTNKNKATYQRVMQSIACLRRYHVDFNILTVLSKQLAKHPQKLYEFYKKEDFTNIQLIPCLAGLEEKDNPFMLTPHLFASFYKVFYNLWLKDFKQGKAMSIYLFDNIIPMFADIPPQQCGLLGYCSLQFVVEANGSVYPCDFYVLDQYCGGNITKMNLKNIAESEAMRSFLQEKKEMSPLCSTCPFISVCHGNCKRMNTLYFDEQYCGYQDFLMHAYPSMEVIAQMLKRR